MNGMSDPNWSKAEAEFLESRSMTEDDEEDDEDDEEEQDYCPACANPKHYWADLCDACEGEEE